MIGAGAVLIGIVLLIFYNLKTSKVTHSKNAKRSNDSEVQKLATTQDTKWFNEKPKNPPSKKAKQKPAHPLSPPEAKSDQNDTLLENQRDFPVRTLEEQRHAMMASITEKQLIGDISKAGDASIKDKATGSIDAHKNSSHTLTSKLENPISPYIIKAGTVIPVTLITGINSELPGPILAQVESAVYDSITHRHLLIPQGAKFEGAYSSKINYGQSRLHGEWRRINFSNGQSIDIEGMPMVDLTGHVGLKDKVNNHYFRIFSSALLMSVLSSGAQLSQTPNTQTSLGALAQPTVGQVMAQHAGTHLIETAASLTSKNLNIAPTIEIREGMPFYIFVTKDIIFRGPYTDEVRIDDQE